MTLTDEYLQGLIDSEPDYTDPAPAIDGDMQAALKDADRHLRHLARIEKRLQEVAELYNDQIDRLQEWHRRQCQRLQHQAMWHRVPLEGLHRSILESDPRRKTIELPHGILKSRTYEKPRVEIESPADVMDWMLANHADALQPKLPGVRTVEQFVRVLPGVDGADGLIVVDKDTGELVPGMAAWVPAPTFDVSTDLDSAEF